MNTKKLKMPVLTILVFVFLLISHLCAFGSRTVSFVLNMANIMQFGGGIALQIVLPYLFSAIASLGLMVSTVLTIVSLLRRRAGKMLLVSLILALCALFAGLISSPLTILLFGYSTTLPSVIGWIGSLLTFGAYLLLTLFVPGALFPKAKVLACGAQYLFFLPCLAECAASLCKTISLCASIAGYLKALSQVSVDRGLQLLFPMINSLSPFFIYLWSPIALLLLGIFIKKAVRAAIPAAPAKPAEPTETTAPDGAIA